MIVAQSPIRHYEILAHDTGGMWVDFHDSLHFKSEIYDGCSSIHWSLKDPFNFLHLLKVMGFENTSLIGQADYKGWHDICFPLSIDEMIKQEKFFDGVSSINTEDLTKPFEVQWRKDTEDYGQIGIFFDHIDIDWVHNALPTVRASIANSFGNLGGVAMTVFDLCFEHATNKST